MVIIILTEEGHIDLNTSRKAYLQADRPRARMLRDLAAQVATTLPSLAQDELEVRIRFAADAILVPGESPYREKEAF